MAFPSLPASPTLTNPDMILPYGEYDSTPSPPQHAMRPESPLGDWNSSKPADVSFSIGPPSHMQLGLGQITPTTPIIYGNGTMLSDIGEVTEAESTPGRITKPIQARLVKGHASPLGSSPTMGYSSPMRNRSKTTRHHRSVSEESNSTVMTDGQVAEIFKDFDDGVSVDDSNFQGDDEESVADDFNDSEVVVAQARVGTRKEGRLIDNDENSSAALSRRAEMILANAKKRLDNMEGNLTRARSSLYITPSSSMSSIHSSSPLSRTTPSPFDAEHRIVNGLGVPPARHRQINNQAVSPSTSPGHMRILSENSIPNYTPQKIDRYQGVTPLSPTRGGVGNGNNTNHPYPTPPSTSSKIQALPEDQFEMDDMEMDLEWDNENIRASTAEPYLHVSNDHRGLTRSSSSMQMRDLTDKMKDLKGKISSLRDRAREENMKRRSLQSLRTPSPFTAAEQWYTSSTAYKKDSVKDDVGMAHNPWNGEPSEVEDADYIEDGENQHTSRDLLNHEEIHDLNGYQDFEDEINNTEQPEMEVHDSDVQAGVSEYDENYHTATEGEEDMEGEIDKEIEDEEYDEEFVDHEELEEYQSEEDGSLYHDSLVTPISHEDREDAFDYEHFFLHSAMGTLGRRHSIESMGSEDSVETTRGPEAPSAVIAEEERAIARGHVKNQKSTDSVSTMASYATATEGRRSEEVQREDDIPEENTYDYAVRPVSDPLPGDSTSHVAAKRSTFGKTKAELPLPIDSPPIESPTSTRPSSVIFNGVSQTSKLSQRTSVSSFASTGTTRSFPLVNKPKNQTPDPVDARPADSRLSQATTLNLTLADGMIGNKSTSIDMLAREDQILIERLVASLGKCVLGLQDTGRATSEEKTWRRRLDAARRVLDGQEGAI